MITFNDIFDISLASAASERHFVVLAGKPGDGSWSQARALMSKGGSEPAFLDFDVQTTPAEIARVFKETIASGRDVLACGFDNSPPDCKVAIVEGLEQLAEQGRKAVLSVKADFEAGLFGKGNFLIGMGISDIPDALAKRRQAADFGGLPSSPKP